MSSPPPQVVAWQQRYERDVTQGAPDIETARHKIPLARTHLVRAEQLLERKEYDLSLMTAELALVACADVVLAKDGYAVRTHVARFAYPVLTPAFTGNGGLLYEIRTARNAAQYDAAGTVAPGLATRAVALARKALAEVTALIP